MTRVASLYYLEHKNQVQIANALGISRQRVSRLLRQALNEQVVRIEVRGLDDDSDGSVSQLENMFELNEAVVVPGGRPAIGEAGAALLQRRIRPGTILGLAWSTSVAAVIAELPSVDAAGVRVVQLDGGIPDRHPHESAHVVREAAMRLGAKPLELLTPLYLDTPEILQVLLGDSTVGRALELARTADIAVFGVGPVSHTSSIYAAGYLKDDDLRELLSNGAVGEALGRFYDARGEALPTMLSERTIGLALDELRKVPVRILIAAGPDKVGPILGALFGGLANVLVTDTATAKKLLAKVESKQAVLG